jgi:hypothetical protein
VRPSLDAANSVPHQVVRYNSEAQACSNNAQLESRPQASTRDSRLVDLTSRLIYETIAFPVADGQGGGGGASQAKPWKMQSSSYLNK